MAAGSSSTAEADVGRSGKGILLWGHKGEHLLCWQHALISRSGQTTQCVEKDRKCPGQPLTNLTGGANTHTPKGSAHQREFPPQGDRKTSQKDEDCRGTSVLAPKTSSLPSSWAGSQCGEGATSSMTPAFGTTLASLQPLTGCSPSSLGILTWRLKGTCPKRENAEINRNRHLLKEIHQQKQAKWHSYFSHWSVLSGVSVSLPLRNGLSPMWGDNELSTPVSFTLKQQCYGAETSLANSFFSAGPNLTVPNVLVGVWAIITWTEIWEQLRNWNLKTKRQPYLWRCWTGEWSLALTPK